MPRYAPNRVPSSVKRRYFELVRERHRGAAAARVVEVSTSCGSLWFFDAGSMTVPDLGHTTALPRSGRRITIADELQARLPVKEAASQTPATSSKSPQTGPPAHATPQGVEDTQVGSPKSPGAGKALLEMITSADLSLPHQSPPRRG